MPHPATIKDIARELKISVATVSRALRDTYDVNKKTRENVLRMAQKLHYTPNINARGLAQGKTYNIGVILPFITNYYFSTVITGIQEVAYNEGYNIILFITNDSPEREVTITQNLSLSSFVGFLISTCASTHEHFRLLRTDHKPVVFFDRVPDHTESSRVMQDDYQGAFDATTHLIAQGYTRIAHLAGPRNIAMTNTRMKGFQDALRAKGRQADGKYIMHSGFSQDNGQADTEKLLALPKPPDALFAVNDRKAIGAMIALKNHKIAIGAGIGVMGFTNDPVSSVITPTLSTMAEPAFEVGRTSCELLLKHIQKKNFPAEQIIIPNTLIVRESTRRS